MFSFREFPFLVGTSGAVNPRQDVPLGDLRIEGCMRLPGAYRCLPRPSSAPEPSHPPVGVGVSDPVSTKPSLVPETLEPVHGVHRKSGAHAPFLLRPSLWSFLHSCICDFWTRHRFHVWLGLAGLS